MNCTLCGVECPRKAWSQKYCRSCSDIKDRERKAGWAAQHGYTYDPEKSRRVGKARKSRLVEVGAERSKKSRGSLTAHSELPVMRRLVRVSVPFDYGFSKNALWSTSRKGHVYIRDEIASLRDGLIWELQASSNGITWFEGKTYLDIFVEKPDARGDAVNVVDLVCDAVKRAIGIDDRWFCITRLDWAIVKEDPQLYVGVAQAIEEHHRACSYCGRILTLDNFGRRVSAPLGVGRECKDCQREARKRKKEEIAA